MIAADDSWYVRFPDGRVIRAANTTVVRQSIHQRHIVAGCMMRRAGAGEWRALEQIREFADAVPAAGNHDSHDRAARESTPGSDVSSRIDPRRLGTAGVLAILQEALAALDTALTRRKLIVAALLTTALAVVFVLTQTVGPLPAVVDYAWPVAVALVAVVTALGVSLLTRLTYVELQRMRPAHWKEGRAGLFALTCRLLVAFFLVALVLVGVPIGFMTLANHRPATPTLSAVTGVLAHASAALALVTSVSFAPLAVAALVLAPVLVFEECSVFAAIRMWSGLLRRNFGRVVLNEIVLVAIAGLLALPLLLAVAATGFLRFDDRLATTVMHTRTVLSLLALTPALAFLVVANVFLFVNLRYPAAHRHRRGREEN